MKRFPVVAMGTAFWHLVQEFLRGPMTRQKPINADDLDIVRLTDDVAEAAAWIETTIPPQVGAERPDS